MAGRAIAATARRLFYESANTRGPMMAVKREQC